MQRALPSQRGSSALRLHVPRMRLPAGTRLSTPLTGRHVPLAGRAGHPRSHGVSRARAPGPHASEDRTRARFAAADFGGADVSDDVSTPF